MTDDTDEEWNGKGQSISLRSRSRRLRLILAFLAVLAISGGAFIWMNFDKFIQLSGNGKFERGETSPGDKAMLTDLLATQQKTGEDLERLNKTVVDQRAQLEAILDQLAAVTSRVDAIRGANPPSLQSVAAQPNARAQVVPKQANRPRAEPPGPVSVGGAPPSVTPDAGTH